MGDPVKVRYAVLHHTGVTEPHYDLLFERMAGGELVAFRLSRWPVVQCGVAIALADHRRVYLTYEGPVSNGRGEVRRVAGGEVLVWELAEGWKITLLAGEDTGAGGATLRLTRKCDTGKRNTDGADQCWSVACENRSA